MSDELKENANMNLEPFKRNFEILNTILVVQYTSPSLTIYTDRGPFIISNFDISELEFDCHGFLHFEPSMNIYQRHKNDQGLEAVNLTPKEIELVTNYITNLLESEQLDLPFPAYERVLDNLYQGVYPLSEIKQNNWGYTYIPCDYPVASYNETTNEWERIKTIIREDGSYIIDPDTYCDLCVKFITEKEWETFTKPPTDNPRAHIAWDFITETWVDKRTPEEAANSYYVQVKQIFESLRSQEAEYFFNIQGYSVTGFQNYFQMYEERIQSDDNVDYAEITADAEASIYKTVFDTTVDTMAPKNVDDMKFNITQYRIACNIIGGQEDAWRNIPDIQKNNGSCMYDKVSHWDALQDKFNEWITKVYG